MFEPVLRFCRKTFGYRTECKVYATAMKKTSSNDNTVISSSSPTAEVEADDAVHGFDNDDDLTFDTSDEVVTVDHKHKTTVNFFQTRASPSPERQSNPKKYSAVDDMEVLEM